MPDSISIGAAYRDQAIDGGSVNSTPIGATTPSTGAFTTLSATGATTLAALTATGNCAIGDAAADTIGFYGKTPASQRASSHQVSSNIVTSASFGTLQVAQLQECWNTLTGLGLWKGAA